MLPPPTLRLQTLLRRYEALLGDLARLEAERAAVRDQILAAGRPNPRSRRQRATPIGADDEIRAVLRVLQEAQAALAPREIAQRLGASPQIAYRRIAAARRHGLVERVDGARYRVREEVPAL